MGSLQWYGPVDCKLFEYVKVNYQTMMNFHFAKLNWLTEIYFKNSLKMRRKFCCYYVGDKGLTFSLKCEEVNKGELDKVHVEVFAGYQKAINEIFNGQFIAFEEVIFIFNSIFFYFKFFLIF